MRRLLRAAAAKAARWLLTCIAFVVLGAWAAGASPSCMTPDELAADLEKTHATLIRAGANPDMAGNLLVLFEADLGNGGVVVTVGTVGPDRRLCILDKATGPAGNAALLIASLWHFRGKGPNA